MNLTHTILGSAAFLSGFAGLLYQVCWQRALTLHYGVGSVSITLIVSVYMLGLGLGGLLGGRLATSLEGTRKRYAGLEIALAVLGLASLPTMMAVGRATAGSSHWVAFVLSFLLLAAPTLLMGATLPLLVRLLTPESTGLAHSVSYLYFINTLGAALGSMSASYGFIGSVGLDGTTWVAATLNLAAGALVWSLRQKPTPKAQEQTTDRAPLHAWALGAVFVTGFVAIALEILWFRLIGVLIKASSYAFASILAVYLLGIALGSLWMNRRLIGRGITDKRRAFFWLQGAIGVTAGLGVAALYHLNSTPFLALTKASFNVRLHPSFPGPDAFTTLERLMAAGDVVFWPLLLLLVPTALMGASFPLIAHLSQRGTGDEARAVGTVYFMATLGNVTGGLITGFVLLPQLGTEVTATLLCLIALMFLPFSGSVFGHGALSRWATWLALSTLMVIAMPGPKQLWGSIYPEAESRLIDEGLEGVVVSYPRGRSLTTFIGGLAHGGRPGPRFIAQAVEAASLCEAPKRVLVIGFGTGSMVEAMLAHPLRPSITVVELSTVLLTNLRRVPELDALLNHDRVTLIIDDARRYLQRNSKTYDLVLMDPLRSTTAYSNNIYSREFFELVGTHLTDRGVFHLWLDEFVVLPATAANVFEHTRVFDTFLLGSKAPLEGSPQRRLDHINALEEQDRPLVEAVARMCVSEIDDSRERSEEVLVNQDLRPITEYYLSRPSPPETRPLAPCPP